MRRVVLRSEYNYISGIIVCENAATRQHEHLPFPSSQTPFPNSMSLHNRLRVNASPSMPKNTFTNHSSIPHNLSPSLLGPKYSRPPIPVKPNPIHQSLSALIICTISPLCFCSSCSFQFSGTS